MDQLTMSAHISLISSCALRVYDFGCFKSSLPRLSICTVTYFVVFRRDVCLFLSVRSWSEVTLCPLLQLSARELRFLEKRTPCFRSVPSYEYLPETMQFSNLWYFSSIWSPNFCFWVLCIRNYRTSSFFLAIFSAEMSAYFRALWKLSLQTNGRLMCRRRSFHWLKKGFMNNSSERAGVICGCDLCVLVYVSFALVQKRKLQYVNSDFLNVEYERHELHF